MHIFHKSVMVSETIAALGCRPGALYLDGTVGGGGHAEAILLNSAPDGRLIGIDADPEALVEAKRRLAPFADRTILVNGNFADMKTILAGLKIANVDGILLDLGVSSHQLDKGERGFSFSQDAPLDMRMDPSRGRSAAALIQALSAEGIERIIRDYGEEPKAKRIARAIVAQRAVAPIRTTGALAALILRALPRAAGHRRIHPATRTFQALRIAVNNELASLQCAMDDGVEMLRPGGRFCVISFHSLEDRIVKDAFRARARGCTCPADLPVCICGRKPALKILTLKPVLPGDEETGDNPRARSAKLRAAERI
jgi:16S rRNA (cytosine1402-N4)-methyltransferase